jgi:hypothetical protein
MASILHTDARFARDCFGARQGFVRAPALVKVRKE